MTWKSIAVTWVIPYFSRRRNVAADVRRRIFCNKVEFRLPTNGPPHPGPLLPGGEGEDSGPSSLASCRPVVGSAASRRRLRRFRRFFHRSLFLRQNQAILGADMDGKRGPGLPNLQRVLLEGLDDPARR